MSEQRNFCFSIFYIFCPPCPKQITEKLIFNPPNPPCYQLILLDAEQNSWNLVPTVNVNSAVNILKQHASFVKTQRGNNIAVLYINCNLKRKYTILYSHGNAADLGQICTLCADISAAFKCDIVCYDYSGYGLSKGKPTEKNLYADIKAAWDYTLAISETSAEKVILYGQSLGTAPTIDLATKVQCAGVVLQSPFKSTLSIVSPNPRKMWSFLDRFKNIEKVPKVTSPVLVIHGTNDEIIDFSHGQAIYERCPRAVEPLWVEGAGHNDIELYGQYVERLRKFINEELSN